MDAAPRVAACACGRLTATCTGDPLRVSVCHCLECKRRTGSAFSTNARFAAGSVRMAGTAREFSRTGDEGSLVTYAFCPDCGVTVWYRNSAQPGMIAIPVGAFATTDFPPPEVSVYDPDRRAPWVEITAHPLTRL